MTPARLLVLSATLTASLASAVPSAASEPPAPAPGAPASGAPAAAAPAADNTARAEALYTEAKAALEAQQPELALQKLTEAWALKRGYDIAANLGSVEVGLKKYRDAAEHLAYALETFPLKGDPDTKKALTDRLALAKAEVGVVTVKASVDGANVSVDGKSLGPAPLKAPIFVEPGHRVFTATRDGYEPARSEVDVKKGTSADVSLELVAKEGSPAGYIVVGIGLGIAGVGIIGGAVLTALANGKAGDMKDLSAELYATDTHCPEGATAERCVDFRDASSSRDSLSNAAMAMWIVGGVGLVAGLGGLIAGASQGSPAQALVLPVFGPGYAGATVSSSF
ncbi:MAG: PEGA domain-containing protein [Polyangiaceae bacterium]|nr:PEGA domain-containing protein [Polyangiaceae bacterium]